MPNTYYGGAEGAFSVTPSDTTRFDQPARALWIGGEGDVAVVFKGGETAVFKAAPVGVLTVHVIGVLSTGTTATEILALR